MRRRGQDEWRVEPAQHQMAQSEVSGETLSPEALEDARLLAAAAEGDQACFAALYRRRSGMIYSLLVRMLVNEMEAQEVMQDAFVQIWRRAHQYNPARSSPQAWMIMIARGFALDRLRARSRQSTGRTAYEREISSLEVEINGARQTERDELAGVCSQALNQLPAEQARALQLAFIRGWTHEEIAGALGEPLGTVKARIRRGLLALRKTLKAYHG